MKYFLLLVTALFFIHTLKAQPPGPSGSGNERIRIYGKVVDGKSKKGIEAVSVMLVQKPVGFDFSKDSVITGMLTEPNGDFSFNDVELIQGLTLVLTPLGYDKIEQPVVNAGVMGPAIDLGNISVVANTHELGNVTVTAEKPALTMGIDRRIFNVEKSIVSTGGTAIDVMRNIPSVSVDVDGNVELRNAAPQIFVDGRPTILTLDQIPADNIEKIELITNPSAKFDASSSGGIINVVLKKNKRIGLNGTASVSGGFPSIVAGNLSVNMRQGKFNFFVSGNYNQSGGIAREETYRQNKRNGKVDNFFNQSSENERVRKFYSLRFGADYFIDNRNTITLTENIVNGSHKSNEEQEQEYLDEFYNLQRRGLRTSDGEFGFNRSNTQLLYTYKIDGSGHQLTADVTYGTDKHTNQSNIVNYYFNPDGSQYSDPNRVRNDGDNQGDQLTVQVDYANPMSETKKFETGLRSYYESNSSIFNAYSLGINGGETKLPLSNNYKFSQTINAAYASFTNKINKFSYQAGLRAEISNFDGKLIDKNEEFGYQYPESWGDIWNALFPSLFLTYHLSEGEDIQVNYSRRIRRPRFWHLNPFFDIQDPVNIRRGNPEIRPEFTNSMELNYNKTYKSGNFLGTIYFRNTTGDITRFSDTITEAQYQELNNAAINPNAILNTFINAKYQNRFGFDLTLQQKIGKQFEIIPNVNVQYRKVDAGFDKIDVSNEGWGWEAKLIANYSVEAPDSWLFSNLSFQVTGEYESPEVIAQGRRKEQYSMDFGLRKDLFKDKKGTLTFNINDVFNSLKWGSVYDTDVFYQDSYRRWRVRGFRLTFSYRFGNPKFQIFRRGGDRNGRDDVDDSNGMGGV